mmetsp:Transcript_87482/g.245624  ORF Transcript_87482/g.245624 Transcript_87482/m.245624 type:complete len:435 (+) Transcript_87482:65-1369(+)|eukprot:CAMPEP_0117471208 /NCGR_PEP_ID=MMETSP0784-20121206/7614_1 /TAXON_ID=39447 /ORGANISM="" /LENGTH=434 /DNA_ID=CAMNT_0005265323 /DNA_START=54 /DNA_END=1358 /DNA_ORIENTATION=-
MACFLGPSSMGRLPTSSRSKLASVVSLPPLSRPPCATTQAPSALICFTCCISWLLRFGQKSRANARVTHGRAVKALSDASTYLTQHEVEAFTAVGDMDGLHAALRDAYHASARMPAHERTVPLPSSFEGRGAGFQKTTAHKLEHDIEQLEYVAARHAHLRDWLTKDVLPVYREMLGHAHLGDPGSFYWFDFAPQQVAKALRPFYNMGIHIPEASTFAQGLGNFDVHAVEHDYAKKRVAVVDNALSPEAFASIRQLLLESTAWHEAKAAHRIGGYVGAYLTDGLYARALLDIGSELSAKLPHIFAGNPLRFLWAYKYDHRYTGVNIHADDAAVNVNIWLTPDCANLSPDNGGLVIYETEPPIEWNESDYSAAERSGFEDLLEPSGWAHVAVPYKANRMVIFDSTLLHKTDDFTFKAGYENRRINLTMLFGERPHA